MDEIQAKPILRVGKLKRTGRHSLAACGGHLARTTETPNADSSRTHLNEWLVGDADIAGAVQSKLERARITRVRTDATLANDVMLSVSPHWFRPDSPDAAGTWDAKRLAVFKREASAFLREQFGNRLVAAVLHLDESTPHIQAIVVPIMKRKDDKPGWRLSGKDMFNQAALTRLQSAWEARLAPHGVGPRQQGSRARHTTLRQYYAALAATPAIPDLAPSPPPLKPFLETPGASQKRMEGWVAMEVAKTRQRLQPLAAAAAKGVLYEAERRAGDFLRSELTQQLAISDRLRSDLAALVEKRELDKAEVARLRGVPVNQVAATLGWTGDMGRKENSIDLLKRVGGLDYRDAVAWLASTFGTDAAAAASAEATRSALEQTPPLPVLTKQDKVKAHAIGQQLDALAAPLYRITLMRDTPSGRVGQNLGKGSESQPEKFWNRNEILTMVPKLSAANARGANVFVTPIDDSVHHALIDDLKPHDLEAFQRLGYAPSLVLETSPDNHQAVVKIATSAAPRAAVNEWFKAINRELGDEKITGLIHPMRLAGFQNRKPKYCSEEGDFPFVRVVQATARLCERARVVVVEMAAEISLLRSRVTRR